MAQFAQNLVFTGLGTIAITVPNAGAYFLDAKISLPTLSNGGGVSAVVAVIKVNASTILTGVAGATGIKADFTCAAGDSVSLILSSAAAADQVLNAVKTTIALGQGV